LPSNTEYLSVGYCVNLALNVIKQNINHIWVGSEAFSVDLNGLPTDCGSHCGCDAVNNSGLTQSENNSVVYLTDLVINCHISVANVSLFVNHVVSEVTNTKVRKG